MGTQDTQGTHKEQKDEEDIREILEALKSDFHKLDHSIEFNEASARNLALLANSRQRMAMTIFAGISIMRDPRLRLASDSGRKRDLSRMIKKALLKNNPAIKKMAEESVQKDSAKSQEEEKKEEVRPSSPEREEKIES